MYKRQGEYHSSQIFIWQNSVASSCLLLATPMPTYPTSLTLIFLIEVRPLHRSATQQILLTGHRIHAHFPNCNEFLMRIKFNNCLKNFKTTNQEYSVLWLPGSTDVGQGRRKCFTPVCPSEHILCSCCLLLQCEM